MTDTVYLEGKCTENGTIVCPLPSSAVIYFLRYCSAQQLGVKFITTEVLKNGLPACCEISSSALEGFTVDFISWENAPDVVRNTCLPSIHQPQASLVRAGLCVVLRSIIKMAHAQAPDKALIDLLGFRQGSMRMCAEVSGWTKLCEVELPDSISQLIESLRSTPEQQENRNVEVPFDLIKLEAHFQKKCKVHNDDKKRRAELVRLKNILNALIDSKKNVITKEKIETESLVSAFTALDIVGENGSSEKPVTSIDRIDVSESEVDIEHTVYLPHGVRRCRTTKTFSEYDSNGASVHQDLGSAASKSGQSISGPQVTSELYLSTLAKVVEELSYLDVEFVHTYSEGPEITLADLILFVYIYFLLHQLNFDYATLKPHLQRIFEWVEHMVKLSAVSATAEKLGWDMAHVLNRLKSKLDHNAPVSITAGGVVFLPPQQCSKEESDEDEMELSRYTHMKHKAYKPEVYQAFKKLESAEIKPVLGQHPCGEQVTVDWDNLPAGIHPRQGDVPEKRTRRKCQQLENLATAVQALAKPGQAIVDFCSGGGHLGIVLAYLLPNCQVYLVENKEESLLKVCSRLKSLDLKNVTLYQCNIDYFIGKFDIGVCLHACGSATDMVLQLCLDLNASFVICPCCYGGIHNTHLLTYPRSKQFLSSSITYKDFLTLGHAADQTEFNIALEGQGRECMNIVDSDRAQYARELGYSVTLCSLQPLTCTPKNNLLVGTPA